MESISQISSTSNLIDHISKKYNYDSKLSNLLLVIIDAMLDYYGEERKKDIYEAFSNTYIHIQADNEDPTQYLTEYFGEPFEFNTNPSLISCANLSISIMKDKKIETKKIVYISNHFKDIDLNKDDVYSDYSLQVLIHELNHCIKNNWEGRVLNDHEFEIATGLNHTVFSTLHTPYDTVSDTFENIEEAVNTLQEYELFKIITGRNPVCMNIYKNNEAVMRRILASYPNLYLAIVDSEFDKDDNWLNYIGKENAIELDNIFKKDILNQRRIIHYTKLVEDAYAINEKIGAYNRQ